MSSNLSLLREKTYTTNKNLIIVQSKLFSPSYAGPGKWIIYNPDNKKALLAIGKDKLPPIIPILAEASSKSVFLSDFSDGELTQMIDNKILIESQEDSVSVENSTFTEKYHKAVYNFPFRNYFDEKWREKDVETMSYYAKLWNQPSVFTERYGERFFLKNNEFSKFEMENNNLDINFLSNLLKTAFGALKVRGEYPNQMVRKISPSGGGKHPTEALIILRKNYEDIKRGLYTYDVVNHALVRVRDLDAALNEEENSISISITSRVERPMWRYREIRSYRAVMIDAGHVIENIRQLCGYAGMYTSLSYDEQTAEYTDFGWVREPELANITISSENKILNSNLSKKIIPHVTSISKRYATNPSLYFSFNNGKIFCNTLWPTVTSTSISNKDFEILTHCLPSRRGDREVTENGIFKKFQVNKTITQRLIECNALIPENVSKKLYQEISVWSNHNWYLNFLVQCEFNNFKNNDKNSSTIKFQNKTILRYPEKLLERRTVRKFNQKELTQSQFQRILFEAISDEDELSIEIIVNVKNVKNVIPGLYLWKENKLKRIGNKLSSNQVRNLIIGQEWAGTGAIDLWIKCKMNLENPKHYKANLIKLGEVGQRICISSTEQNIGTFMTPAIRDDITFETLGISNPLSTVLYHFTIGHKGDSNE